MVHHIFLSAITTTFVLVLMTPTTTLAQGNDPVVYDVYGEPLKQGQSYYLVPTDYFNVNGGVKPLPIGPTSCPYTFYVSEEDDKTNFGTPIAFSTRSNKILLSDRLEILFPRFPPSYVLCRRYFPRVWGISTYNSTYVVEVNANEGSGTSFTIEDDKEGNYQINTCVTRNKCGSLSFLKGVYYDKVVLGINFTKPMSFVFEPNPLSSPRSVEYSRQTHFNRVIEY